ncbi:hypothetical protein ACWGJP_11965 [Microbacterium sp. NPDC055903]
MAANDDFETAWESAHRQIRTIRAGEGPYAGMLVSSGERRAVLVELEPQGAPIDWRFAGAEHVAAPLDIARRRDGHAALLPWCRTRMDVFLAQRRDGAPLEPGETTNLAASMLRGVREIVERADHDLPGEWWLGYDGRPLCVPGGSHPALTGAGELIRRLADDSTDRSLRRMLGEIADALRTDAPGALRAQRWERDLFEFASPRALHVRMGPEDDEPGSVSTHRAVGPQTRLRERRGVWSGTVEMLRSAGQTGHGSARDGANVRARIGGAATRRWPRTEARGELDARAAKASERSSSGPGRRRLLLVGTSAATAVIAIGVLWPSAEEPRSGAVAAALEPAAETPSPPDAAGTETPSPVASTAPDETGEVGAEPQPTPSTSARETPEPVAAVIGLIESMDACAEGSGSECPDAIAEGSSVRPEQVLRAEDAGAPVLVDDYGDLAVVRIGAQDERAQMMVLIRIDDEWLVRDVYDVADQP